MKKFVALLRVKHWIKNIFVFVAAFFGQALDFENLFNLFVAFFSFCFLASAIYIVNDFFDIKYDKNHPIKSSRPLASGEIKPPLALLISAILAFLSFTISFLFLQASFVFILVLYAVINLFYSFGLKKVSILDLILVSSGFVLRVIGGAEVVEVELSFWLLLMTFLFSMFIVIGKRRNDFIYGDQKAKELRSVNTKYNKLFLDYSILIFSTLMLVCYVMYTYFSPYFQSNIYLALASSVLVFIGLLRYLQAIFVEGIGGNPTEFAIKDSFIKIVLFLWVAVFGYLIYFG